jgi:hypothetical protein
MTVANRDRIAMSQAPFTPSKRNTNPTGRELFAMSTTMGHCVRCQRDAPDLTLLAAGRHHILF